MKHSLTKRSRTDLNRAMIGMCALDGGWQITTLNPDLSDADKLRLTTERFGVIAVGDDPDELYTELVRLSAVTMGWAQGIERRATRDRRRLSRAIKRERKAEKRRLKETKRKHEVDDHSDCDH